MRRFLLLTCLLPAVTYSASLAEQVQSLEKQTAKADVQQGADTREIQQAIYDRYAASARLIMSAPTVSSVSGNKARVQVSVSVQLPGSVQQDMQRVIDKNIDARLEDSELTYSFDDWCYRGLGQCAARLKSRSSPAVWGELAHKALGVEVNFLGRQQRGILIGQIAGDIGKVLGKGTFRFEFEVPKAALKSNPAPKAAFVLYKCKWTFDNPAYHRLKSY